MAPSFPELLREVKSRIRETTVDEVAARLESADRPIIIDVREQDEFDDGHIPGALHIPRGFLEPRIEAAVPDRGAEIVLQCAGGVRSAFAADSLQQLGYTNVTSLAGGFGAWKQAGRPFVIPQALSAEQRRRYSRHLSIPEVGEEGQQKLLNSRVLLIGAGGLGSPAALYLAAAGVGTLGLVDADLVDDSNLQRQVIHSTDSVGRPKVDSARERIEGLNPDVKVITHRDRLTSENVMEIIGAYDVVVDGTDNFPTRYLVNDVCVWLRKPNIHGSVFRFDGQASVFLPGDGPCYRCLYPEPPPPDLAPNCDEAGVLGVLPGLVGLIQATEAIKVILGIGRNLSGRLLTIDAADMVFRELRLRRDPACPVCGDRPSITEPIDYELFCSATVA